MSPYNYLVVFDVISFVAPPTHWVGVKGGPPTRERGRTHVQNGYDVTVIY